jgi:hypothetical protein
MGSVRPRLLVEYEKAALDMPLQDPVPHDQGPAFTEGVPETDTLSGRQRGLRMGRSEATPAVVYQASSKFPGV